VNEARVSSGAEQCSSRMDSDPSLGHRRERRHRMGERVQESCEPCEGNRDTGERLDAIKMVEDKLAIALAHVGDPDIAPAAARPPHEVISAEIDAQPSPVERARWASVTAP
jgi:hypothetical protein